MHYKTFTRLFLLMGMIGLMSVPLQAEEVTIGSGTETNAWLPSHSYYKYSLTQQIYTADEIGGIGTINSIAFFNGGSEKTRTYDIYLVNTEKSSFSGASDWISVSSNDLVFSGSVTMTENAWTTIHFTSAFDFAGDNLAVVVNDKTGDYSQGMSCRVFTPSGDQGVVSLYASKDGSVNYDLSNPGNASGTVTIKNQIILDIEMASVTCAKPKNFNAESITSHTATLTWTAGAEGQSNWDVYVTTDATIVPDENTTPTYQVTECTKALNSLETQTTYYAFVRSACGGDDGNSKWASTSFTTTREALTIDAENPYSQDFEDNNDWTFANGTFTNQWCWGSATNNGGEKAMYISDDNGVSNNYSHSALVVYASKLFGFAQGTYTFSFDWRANGESSYDFLRVALVPGDKTFTAGGSLPSGVTASGLPSDWISLDGGSKLNQSSDWQTKVTETALSGTYTMVFLWRNDGSGGSQPPAAIDNISISYMTCPRPTNLTASNIASRTATLSWTENGTADGWTLQYATDASFNTNLVETSEGFTVNESYVGYGLTGLSGETKYYVRVKSNCESSWSDVINFTTNPTCVKPTNVTSNDITAYSAVIGWTNGEEGQEAWEISYSTTTQSDPENGTVVAANANPYTLTGLTPETSYYVYVRANCGDEDGKSAWSSYKYFTTLATCIKPTNLTASNVTSSTATITWAAGEADQTAWNLQYKKSSDSEWTSISTDATTCNLENLSPVTTYNVRVQADCGDGDLSQWTTDSFTTTCGALELPYTYGFEDNLVTTSPYSSSNPFPKCWGRVAFQSGYSGNYTYYPYVFTATTSQPYAHGGNGANTYSGHSMRFYQTSSSTNECAVLPEISDEYEMNHLQIRFWAAVQSSQGTLKIGIMESQNDASTFTSIQEVTISNTYSNGFQEFTVPFSTYTGNGRYIAFMCGTGSSYAYFLIDDITVEEIPSTFTKDITGYGSSEDACYYLISSPIGTVDVENVTNLITNSYDLYYFNQSQDLEWRNYKDSHFNLVSGKGYLYANSEDVTLTFTGVPYCGNGQVTLLRDDDADLPGWNLVGNPFAQTAYINKPFYKMNQDGTALSATTSTGAIDAMEGVFVNAASDGETLTFSTSELGKQAASLMLNVTQKRGASTSSATIDRAIISFSEESPLPKFQLNPNHTKVYIPQDGKDYAVVHGEGIGELPVNFKAEEDGTYTLAFSSEDVAFNYLHLIDNMTGMDVDLLQNSSYSFGARKSDYASRFRLVFSANGNASDDDDVFAFFSNDKLVVLNEGKATLQVVDVMGRVLCTKQISGNAEVRLSQPSGLYMLRLTNGSDVKVQKVVVK